MNLQGRNLFSVTFVLSCFHNKQNAAENLRLVLRDMGTIFAAPNRIFSALYFLMVLVFLSIYFTSICRSRNAMPFPVWFASIVILVPWDHPSSHCMTRRFELKHEYSRRFCWIETQFFCFLCVFWCAFLVTIGYFEDSISSSSGSSVLSNKSIDFLTSCYYCTILLNRPQ